MYKVNSLILKNIHTSKLCTVGLPLLLAKISNWFLKRLKSCLKPNTNAGTIMWERFSEGIHSIMNGIFGTAPYILYWTSSHTPTAPFMKNTLLNPLVQWESSGYKEWFTFSEFLTKFKKLLCKALPDNLNKKVLFQLWPEEHIVMIIFSFLKDPTVVRFGTTHVLLKSDSLLQLEQQVKETWLVRHLPDNSSILVSFIKSKFLDLNRNRDIKIKVDPDMIFKDEHLEVNLEMLSKCSSKQNLMSRNNQSLLSKGSVTTPSNIFNTSISINSTLLPTQPNELYKKVLSYKKTQKTVKNPKAKVDTKYTRALKQYFKKRKNSKDGIENIENRDINFKNVQTVKKWGIEIPQFWIIEKGSKFRNKLAAAVVIQKYYRGYVVRRSQLLEMLRKYKQQRDIAARIIQTYWKQYNSYLEMVDHLRYNEDLNTSQISQENSKKLKDIGQKRKEKLGLIDYEFRPKISKRSRKLAQKRRNDMGMKNLHVEDVLIQERKMKNALKERTNLENRLKEERSISTSRKATVGEINSFYQKQKLYKENVDNKLKQQRDNYVAPENTDLTLKPKINKTSKSLKRDYNDLLRWKINIESKLNKKRKEKEMDEDTSLKSFHANKHSRSFVRGKNSIISQRRNSNSIGDTDLEQTIKTRESKSKSISRTIIWPLKFEKPSGSSLCTSQLSGICQSMDLGIQKVDSHNMSFY